METNNDTGRLEDTVPAETPDRSDVIIELRHEAGLTAGQTMLLGVGRYEFGPTIGEGGGLKAGQPTVVSFELDVIGPDNITLSPRGIEIKIDGRPAISPEILSPGQVIQAGPDHFVVGEPDDFVSLTRRTQPRITVPRVAAPEFGATIPFIWLWIGLILLGVLLAVVLARPWILLALAGIGLAVLSWWRQRQLDRAEQVAHTHALERANTQLSKELSNSRSLMSRQCRAAHLSPSNIVSGTTEIGSTDDHSERTGRIHIAIGLGDVSWQPPVSDRKQVGWDYKSLVEQYSSLSAVPYLLDLEAGPLGLVGPAAATAAVTRYLSQATDSVSGKSLTIEALTSTNRSDPDPLRGRVLLVAENQAYIPKGCLHTIILDDRGYASVQTSDGTVVAADLVPHGLPGQPNVPNSVYSQIEPSMSGASTEHDGSANEALPSSADEILSLASTRSEVASDRSEHFGGVQLYTSDSAAQSKDFLAGIGLELAYRRSAARLQLTILDSGDRGLVRLSQLPHCVGYAALDDEEEFAASISRLSEVLNQPSERLQVILASEFPRLIAFLQLSGRQSMANHLLELARQTEQDRLVLVASATTEDPGSIPKHSRTGNITRSVSLLRESPI